MSGPRNPYRTLLAHPGALFVAVFGLMGRAPMAMFSVALVAAASSAAAGGRSAADAAAGYALGGVAAGATALASSLAAPFVGRAVDRRGQEPLIRYLALACAASALAIVASLLILGPTILIVPLAALAGATQPGIGTFTRARWAALFHGTPSADSAQALESINDEISFLIGPSLVAILATVGFVGLPIVVAVVLLLVGVFGMTSRRSLPAPAPHPGGSDDPRWPPFPAGRGLLLATGVLGLALGSVQVLQLAYCRALGLPEATALVFFVYSLASLVGALLVGSMVWRTPARRRLTIALLVYSVGILPTALVGGYLPFVLAAALAGMAIAPTFIQGNAVVAEETPTRWRSGAFAVYGSATILGIAAGNALAGFFVDRVGALDARLVIVPLALAIAIAAIAADLLGGRRPAGAVRAS